MTKAESLALAAIGYGVSLIAAAHDVKAEYPRSIIDSYYVSVGTKVLDKVCMEYMSRVNHTVHSSKYIVAFIMINHEEACDWGPSRRHDP